MNESPLDRALDLLLSDDPSAALRWSLAALERYPSDPRALFFSARALSRLAAPGTSRAAVNGLRIAARRAAAAGDLAIAIAAIGDLRPLGEDARGIADEVAALVSREGASARRGSVSAGPDLTTTERPRAFSAQSPARPLSGAVGGRALVSRATQMIYEAASAEPQPVSPLAFFGDLSREGARALILALETATVRAGHCLIEEGETTDCGFILAHGEAEIARAGASDRRVVASLRSGALFGELALLARLPSPANVVTTKSSVLLVAWRDAIDALSADHPDVRGAFGAHCMRQAAANLGDSLGVLDAVPLHERGALVERMTLRTFERGAKLANLNHEADGLHVLVSGEVLLVARDGSERVVLQTLAPGDTVGEIELVLCRAANAEAVAVSDGATLFLPREEFFALSREYPAILHGVYSVASRRQAEMTGALGARAAPVDEDCLVDDPPAAPIKASVPAIDSAPAVPVPASAPPPSSHPSHVAPAISARATLGMTRPSAAPTSLAPTMLSQKPPAPFLTARGAFSRSSVRITALVAFAAGVSAVLAPRGDRRAAFGAASSGGEHPPFSDVDRIVLPAEEPAAIALAAATDATAVVASAPASTTVRTASLPPSHSIRATVGPHRASAADGTPHKKPAWATPDEPSPGAASDESPPEAPHAAPPAPAPSATAHASDDFGARE